MNKYKTRRDKRIDSFKGLFLVIMTIDHFEGILSKITNETFGYVSAAEGFIFLSGYVFALVYMKYVECPKILILHSLKRAWFVYKYHIALMSIVVITYFMSNTYHESWIIWLDLNEEDLYHYLIYTIFLLYQPNYMDILAIYVIFLIFSPFILIGFGRGYIWFTFLVSVGLWVLGQSMSFMASIISVLELPTADGYFNLFSWQLIWTIGIFIGYLKFSNIEVRLHNYKLLVYVVFVFVLVMLLDKHNILEFGDNFIQYNSEKRNLNIFRLLNFLSMLFLIWIFIRNISPEKGVPWLEFLGRYSIQVFSFHVLLLYFLKPIWSNIDKLNHLHTISFMLLTVMSLTIPAYLSDKLKKTKK